jgi:hypothetical protein
MERQQAGMVLEEGAPKNYEAENDVPHDALRLKNTALERKRGKNSVQNLGHSEN